MSARTVFLSRLLGLYCIVIALCLGAHKQASLTAIEAVCRNPGMMLMIGVIALGTGLAIVLAHNVWSGGALPVVVTLIGWLSIVKGAYFLLLSPDAMAALMSAIDYPRFFYVFMAKDLLIGLYLTVGGFRKRRLISDVLKKAA